MISHKKSNVEGKIDEEKLCYFYMITLAPPPSHSFSIINAQKPPIEAICDPLMHVNIKRNKIYTQ